MTLDPKALSAARKAHWQKSEMSGSTAGGGHNLGAAIQAYLDAADMVRRPDHEAINRVMDERDEARRKIDRMATDEAKTLIAVRHGRAVAEHSRDRAEDIRDQAIALADERGKQIAVLRGALVQIDKQVTVPLRFGPRLRKLLTDTASAASEYQRVPEECVVRPKIPTEKMVMAGAGAIQTNDKTVDLSDPSDCILMAEAVDEAMLAAAVPGEEAE